MERQRKEERDGERDQGETEMVERQGETELGRGRQRQEKETRRDTEIGRDKQG